MESPELHRLHGELLEAGVLHGGVVVPVPDAMGVGWTAIRAFPHACTQNIVTHINEK